MEDGVGGRVTSEFRRKTEELVRPLHNFCLQQDEPSVHNLPNGATHV